MRNSVNSAYITEKSKKPQMGLCNALNTEMSASECRSLAPQYVGMAELADASDSKSDGLTSCGFDSHYRHQNNKEVLICQTI